MYGKYKVIMFGFFKKNKTQTKQITYEKVIIVGAGEVGYHLAKRLSRDERSIVVIDKNPKKLENIQNSLDVQTVLGSGSNPQTLENAGVLSADVCIAATDDDEGNILISSFAAVLNPAIKRLARIRNQDYIKYLDKLEEKGIGIDLAVNPEYEVVKTIDRLLSLPQALDYAEFAQGNVRMVCYKIEEGSFIGRPLIEFKSLVGTNEILVAAIRRNGTLFIPFGEDTIEIDDIVYFIYKSSHQKQLLAFLNKNNAIFSSACIVGGGNIGFSLAKLFENKGIQVKLIEANEQRGKYLASELKTSLVLLGDAREKELLNSEAIGKMDVFVAVTGDEETNILTCLLAKSLGVRDTIAKVNKVSYVSLLSNIGIDHNVSPRIAAVNTFSNYIREGKVLTSVSIGSDEAEIIELALTEESPYLDKALKDLKLPKGLILVSILRKGIVIIPDGNTVLHKEDHIIVLCTQVAFSLLNLK